MNEGSIQQRVLQEGGHFMVGRTESMAAEYWAAPKFSRMCGDVWKQTCSQPFEALRKHSQCWSCLASTHCGLQQDICSF